MVLKIDAMHMPLVINKKNVLFYFLLSNSINDIQLKMFVFVVVKYVLYNNDNKSVERAESVVSA